mmetsp:Transcript_6952/g.6481  ORF Transcript_6952/g.6481 Transcript_6952/m.6481 type:complete len:84 (+) Transcript_6952:4711-4962(+)
MGSIDGGQMRSSQTVEPILLLIGKIVLKVMMAYFACKQLAFNENHEYWKNKDLLDNIHTNVSKENTRDYVSEMFRRESEDEED